LQEPEISLRTKVFAFSLLPIRDWRNPDTRVPDMEEETTPVMTPLSLSCQLASRPFSPAPKAANALAEKY
jgi:hypothetical protein